ncbi:hypothetical protein GGTG_12969 [Gaeumannomyces tritici R3-111a-1]|uniref:Rpb7-binding protein seb1 n=1 Tax=Gaeumannomyces tritici (strain R3-111a-1) TaxID=644352 RepID=J3PHI9_GAET3|nr:hypothetical protein GGTG_12969 [Gaeumannomyces tritici R3-111a-1]EJT69350.1 hypothetical protein GGTG_12969 [Gaeumannomyces tritici R3-111a-1]
MSSMPVTELEAGLVAMQALKPPGVSGSRIKDITALCVSNIKSESVIIQKIFTHFKRTNGTHKLGVLYVVDSVTRKWMEQAKQLGQTVSSAAEDGTYAAGVHRVTELMPSFMNDILASAPEDQKEKIRKLVDIWEKGQTFPSTMLEGWKARLNAPKVSTTPPGSPPPNLMASLMSSSSAAPAAPPALPAMTNIMETLANIARQNASAASSNPSITAPAPAPAPAPAAAPLYVAPSAPPASSSVLPPALLAALAQAQVRSQAQVQPAQPSMPFFPATQPPAVAATQPPVVAPHTLPFQLPTQFPGAAAPFAASVPAPASQAGGFPAAGAPSQVDSAQQLVLIQTLLSQGFTPDMVTAIVKQFSGSTGAAAAAPQYGASQGPGPYGFGSAADANSGGWNAGRIGESHDRDFGGNRSPGRGARGRSRSRSPGRNWDNRHSPRGRDDRQFGDRDRGRGSRGEYRQRSPAGQGRRTSSPRREGRPDRFIEFDRSLPENHIRVLSRTLFIGGVTCPESELRAIFSRFGEVQTCIVNRDKRHGFVKMLTRKDAVAAKEGMAEMRTADHQLRTRWGVGFGPRDCSDYSAGISVIPIHRLTEADRKWMLTAPFGGTGGKPITTGMVVEEPDIEIGAGVSSKAISRRMQTDRSGIHGPRSSRDDEGGQQQQQQPQQQQQQQQQNHGENGGGGHGRGGRRRGGGRDHNRRGGDDNSNNSNNSDGGGGGKNQSGGANNVGVPDFGFGLTAGSNGMPIFPPGFSFPAPEEQRS